MVTSSVNAQLSGIEAPFKATRQTTVGPRTKLQRFGSWLVNTWLGQGICFLGRGLWVLVRPWRWFASCCHTANSGNIDRVARHIFQPVDDSKLQEIKTELFQSGTLAAMDTFASEIFRWPEAEIGRLERHLLADQPPRLEVCEFMIALGKAGLQQPQNEGLSSKTCRILIQRYEELAVASCYGLVFIDLNVENSKQIFDAVAQLDDSKVPEFFTSLAKNLIKKEVPRSIVYEFITMLAETCAANIPGARKKPCFQNVICTFKVMKEIKEAINCARTYGDNQFWKALMFYPVANLLRNLPPFLSRELDTIYPYDREKHSRSPLAVSFARICKKYNLGEKTFHQMLSNFTIQYLAECEFRMDDETKRTFGIDSNSFYRLLEKYKGIVPNIEIAKRTWKEQSQQTGKAELERMWEDQLQLALTCFPTFDQYVPSPEEILDKIKMLRPYGAQIKEVRETFPCLPVELAIAIQTLLTLKAPISAEEIQAQILNIRRDRKVSDFLMNSQDLCARFEIDSKRKYRRNEIDHAVYQIACRKIELGDTSLLTPEELEAEIIRSNQIAASNPSE